MADRRTNSPTASSTFEISESTCLYGMPIIDATCDSASSTVAADACKDFVRQIHGYLQIILYLIFSATTSASHIQHSGLKILNDV